MTDWHTTCCSSAFWASGENDRPSKQHRVRPLNVMLRWLMTWLTWVFGRCNFTLAGAFKHFLCSNNIWDNPSHWRTHIFLDGEKTTQLLDGFKEENKPTYIWPTLNGFRTWENGWGFRMGKWRAPGAHYGAHSPRVWMIISPRYYSDGHLLVITGYKWDYTFYKWGFVSTYNW